jgi:hypothetical protein
VKQARAFRSKGVLANWHIWGLPAFAQIFAPWHEKIISMSLISDWFQPTLNIAASILGPLVCMITYGVMRQSKRQTKWRVAAIASLGFLALLLACLFMRYTLELIAAPGPIFAAILWVLWATIYLGLFIALGLAMTSGAALFDKQA